MVGLIIAAVIAVPIILFPVALIWYFNVGGIYHAVKEARAAREKKLATAKITR
jgi:hypothetical protein